MISHLQGSMMFIIDIDTENGGMQMNNDFCVDFGDEPDGPALAHEVILIHCNGWDIFLLTCFCDL